MNSPEGGGKGGRQQRNLPSSCLPSSCLPIPPNVPSQGSRGRFQCIPSAPHAITVASSPLHRIPPLLRVPLLPSTTLSLPRTKAIPLVSKPLHYSAWDFHRSTTCLAPHHRAPAEHAAPLMYLSGQVVAPNGQTLTIVSKRHPQQVLRFLMSTVADPSPTEPFHGIRGE